MDKHFKALLAHLYRGGSWGYYWTPDGPEYIDANGDTQRQKVTHWFAAGQAPDIPGPWKKNHNVYFGVNPVAVKRGDNAKGRIDDVDAVNCLYAEFDADDLAAKPDILAELIKMKLAGPSVIVDSGSGFHAYWLLKTPYIITTPEDRQRIIDVQYAWNTYVGGDSNVKDLARVLRVPGTKNYKAKFAPDFPTVTTVLWEPTRDYDLVDLEDLVKTIIQAQAAQHTQHTQAAGPNASATLADADLVDKMLNGKNGDMLRRLWNGDLSDANGDHSKADILLCNALAFWTGKDYGRMDSLFRTSGLYRKKWDRDDYRDKTLRDAIAHTTEVWTPGHGMNGAVAGAQAMGASSNGATPPPSQGATQAAGPSASQKLTFADLGRIYLQRYPHTMYSRNQWYRYSNGVWAPLNDMAVQRELWDLTEDHVDDVKPSKFTVSNIESWVQANSFIDPEALDTDDELINLTNGTYDLGTGALLTHNPGRLMTTQLPFAYDAAAQCPTWLYYVQSTFVEKDGVTHDPKLAEFIQEAMGYSLTTDIRHHVTFWCYGEGANGKSVLTAILEALGGSAAIPFNVNLLSREQYQLADLAGKRIAICTEAATQGVVDDAIVKAIVVGDSLQVRQIRREPFTLHPRVKLWWAMNKLPKVADTSAGFWRRIRVVPFHADFELNRNRRIDDLVDKLLDELPGIFNWAMEGLHRLRANGGFTKVPQIESWTAQYREDSDTVYQFLLDRCDVDPGHNVLSSSIYASYRDWTKENGYYPMSIRNFKDELARLKIFGIRRGIGVVYFGVRLKGTPNVV